MGGSVKRVVLLLVVCAVSGCDQWTKQLVRREPFESRTFLGGALTITHAENRGAFLSLGSMLSDRTRITILTVGVAVLLAAALIALFRNPPALRPRIALALIIGGGVGNLIDRIARSGFVTDFLYLRAGPLHTGVFNIADVAITGGVLWMVWRSRSSRPPSRHSAAPPTRDARP